MTDRVVAYEPLTVERLGVLLGGADETRRWRLVAEFLEEYRWESVETRSALLAAEPAPIGDERWGVFLAALAEHLSARDGRGAPRHVRCGGFFPEEEVPGRARLVLDDVFDGR